MVTGRVKRFNEQTGFGFIAQEGGAEDVFIHYTDLAVSDLKSLKEGQAVSFEVTRTQKGLRAIDVKLL